MLGISLAIQTTGHAPTAPVAFNRAADSFDRAKFADPESIDAVRSAHSLHGTGCCVAGWAEYDFRIPETGWYQIWTDGVPNETIIDAPNDPNQSPLAYFAGASGLPGPFDKIGNVWLGAGAHRIRLQSDLWYGFANIHTIELRRATDAIADRVSIPWPHPGLLFRANQCPRFTLEYGGLPRSAYVLLAVRDETNTAQVRKFRVDLPATPSLSRSTWDVPCDREGYFSLEVADTSDSSSNQFESRLVKGFHYRVVDTTHAPPASPVPAQALDETIDCARRMPDYGHGATVVREAAGTRVRESGATGWVEHQVAGPSGLIEPKPDWFAYLLHGIVDGSHYRIDVEVPDDGDRTFGIVLREANQLMYSIGTGVDTGGPFPVSGGIQVVHLDFWARGVNPRLVFLPERDGTRAACARIRLRSQAPPDPSPRVPHPANLREYASWYEEGESFVGLFGATQNDEFQTARASDRWAATVAASGGTTLVPTVLVYAEQLYPSLFNRIDMHPERDTLRRLVFSAERYGLKIIPEIHPRADELVSGLTERETRRLLAISRNGTDNFVAEDGKTRNRPPHYNALLPGNQAWMIAMIGELADRYRDSPAIEVIRLRYMAWAYAALDNLVGLEWGYDDGTVRRFATATGVRVPGLAIDAPDRFRARYVFLTGPGREAWIRWRCEEMARFLARIAERVRASRADLKIYLHVFPLDDNRPFSDRDTPTKRLREVGLDPEMLRAIPGVEIIDSSESYGRRSPSGREIGIGEATRNPAVLASLSSKQDHNLFISAHRYLEINETAATPSELALPGGTNAVWTSLAAPAPGYFALENYCRQLALTDAFMIGNGGNGAIFESPQAEEFVRTFTSLPAARFRDRTLPGMFPLVRSRQIDKITWLYAVNCSPTPAQFGIAVAKSTGALGPEAQAVPGNEPIDLRSLTVQPFSLRALRVEAPETDVEVRVITTRSSP